MANRIKRHPHAAPGEVTLRMKDLSDLMKHRWTRYCPAPAIIYFTEIILRSGISRVEVLTLHIWRTKLVPGENEIQLHIVMQ